MVKERKRQTGSTNLDSSRPLDILASMGQSNYDSENFRSTTHKLVVPDPPVFVAYDYTQHQRTIPKTSTWKSGNPVLREYSTIQEESYINPTDQAAGEVDPNLAVSLKADEKRRNAQNMAVDKLNRVSKLRFGSCEKMFKAVRANDIAFYHHRFPLMFTYIFSGVRDNLVWKGIGGINFIARTRR